MPSGRKERDMGKKIEILQELVNQQVEEIDWQFKENERLRQTNNALIYLCLFHGNISRGKACECLGIKRDELDEWMEEQRTSWKSM